MKMKILDESIELGNIKICLDKIGKLVENNQVLDYWYRDDRLSNLNFYNFSRCVRLEKQSTNHSQCIRTFEKYNIKPPHCLSGTHQLVLHTPPHLNILSIKCLVPRVIGCSIPRKNSGKQYAEFMLAHFKPFSENIPLINNNETIEEAFDKYTFDSFSYEVMNNWEAIRECEDAHDADRIHKRAQLTAPSNVISETIQFGLEDDIEIDIHNASKPISRKDLQLKTKLQLLENSNWFTNSVIYPHVIDAQSSAISLPEITMSYIKKWKCDIKIQESVIAQRRLNLLNAAQQDYYPKVTTLSTKEINHILTLETKHQHEVETTSPVFQQITSSMTPGEICTQICKKYHLNKKQRMVFVIASNAWLQLYAWQQKNTFENSNSEQAPQLRMVITGPGGTGKTYAIQAVNDIMNVYGCEHSIHYLAPTGGAAKIIGGMTVHKGLGIAIKKRNNGKQNRSIDQDNEDYTVTINIKKLAEIHTNWKNVDVLVIDEIGGIGQQLICEIDQALHIAKERSNAWFGGMIVIFCGDFYQHAPVSEAPLYQPISNSMRQNNTEIKKRLGRLAWKSIDTVIELNEQKQMENDIEYAAAVNCLRLCQCTIDDVELFNSRLIKGTINPHGIDMGLSENLEAIAIVSTNLLRYGINMRKAEMISKTHNGPKLIICAAHDTINNQTVPKEYCMQLLQADVTSLSKDGALPAFIPLYIGMPVFLRNRNLSTDLKITNGSKGIVHQISIEHCSSNFIYAKAALVEFSDSLVKCSDIPRGHFIIEPQSWTFTTLLTDSSGTKINKK